jgi:predicted DNA-binding protein
MEGKMKIKRDRGDGGKFLAKSDDERHVRSIRATDETWEVFGELAASRGQTRADLLETLMESGSDEIESAVDQDTLDEVVELLKEGLTIKANTGGAIKQRIRSALEILGEELDED